MFSNGILQYRCEFLPKGKHILRKLFKRKFESQMTSEKKGHETVTL